jgi:NAD dependent epimerase/dehydratase family enzyme
VRVEGNTVLTNVPGYPQGKGVFVDDQCSITINYAGVGTNSARWNAQTRQFVWMSGNKWTQKHY